MNTFCFAASSVLVALENAFSASEATFEAVLSVPLAFSNSFSDVLSVSFAAPVFVYFVVVVVLLLGVGCYRVVKKRDDEKAVLVWCMCLFFISFYQTTKSCKEYNFILKTERDTNEVIKYKASYFVLSYDVCMLLYVPTLEAKVSTSFKALISPFFPSLAFASASLSLAAINAFLAANAFFSAALVASVALTRAVLASPSVFLALVAASVATVASFLAFSTAAFSAASGSTTLGGGGVGVVVVVVVVVVVAGVVEVKASAGSTNAGVAEDRKMVDAAKMERMDFLT